MESQIGYERFFDPDDIFFSTTDAKGVIQRSNRTFDTLSRYTRERLMRSPHNIIRHLDMPAGVFKLMWDDLQAGLPACAYVKRSKRPIVIFETRMINKLPKRHYSIL